MSDQVRAWKATFRRSRSVVSTRPSPKIIRYSKAISVLGMLYVLLRWGKSTPSWECRRKRASWKKDQKYAAVPRQVIASEHTTTGEGLSDHFDQAVEKLEAGGDLDGEPDGKEEGGPPLTRKVSREAGCIPQRRPSALPSAQAWLAGC